jgi:hypothetical protein
LNKFENPFAFSTQQRKECSRCHGVKYKSDSGKSIFLFSLPFFSLGLYIITPHLLFPSLFLEATTLTVQIPYEARELEAMPEVENKDK